jgi:hypothetical protein
MPNNQDGTAQQKPRGDDAPQPTHVAKKDTAENKHSEDTHDRPGQHERPTKEWFRVVNLILTGLLVAVGIAYSCVEYRQWAVMRAQTDVMAGQLSVMNAELRSTVNFRGVSGITRLVVGPATRKSAGFILLLGWENSGTTPAVHAYNQNNVALWPYDLPKDFDFRDAGHIEPKQLVVGPKAVFTTPVVLTLQNVRDLTRGLKLFIWGWITYHDTIAGTPTHLTEYCIQVLDLHSASPGDLADATKFEYLSTGCPIPHDCYDKDCPDYESRVKQEPK